MMSVLEVDIGTWPKNANASLRQMGGLCARPGAHGFDRKCPDPKASCPARRQLVRPGKHKNFLSNLVLFVYF
jgi:hypothetical protein